MRLNSVLRIFVVSALLLGGCTKYHLVNYGDVHDTNSVEVTLQSGEKVKGTVQSIEPHQIVVSDEEKSQVALSKTNISIIKRKKPVYDDFGRGISEEEIASTKTNRNTIVYGVGGGALSFGASFFLGSLAANSMDNNSGIVLGGATMAGGGLGTFLFVRAGKAKDRHDAIEEIREMRRTEKLEEQGEPLKTQTDLDKQLKDEKKKHEALRKEREELLRELEKKEKKKKKG